MSMKINKNGKEYPIGVIPQNYIQKVNELAGKVTIGLTEARACFIAPTTCTFSSGSCTQDLSASIPSGYRISTCLAQPVDTGSVCITGCKRTPDTNGSVTVRAISGGSSYSGTADIVFLLSLLPIS